MCLLPTCVAGCGDAAPVAGRETAPSERRLLRILDPSGRIYLHFSSPAAFTADGRLSTFPRQSELLPTHGASAFDLHGIAPDTEIVIIAQGCRVERLKAPAEGDAVVRLRRGIPVRVRVAWDGALPEGATQFGIGLESKGKVGDTKGQYSVRLQSIGSDWMDRDLPTKPNWTPMRGADADVLLYVPEAGEYKVQWHLDAPNRGSSYSDRTFVTISEQTGEAPLELDVPAAWMAKETADAKSRSGR